MRLKAIALAGLLTSVPAFAEDKVVVPELRERITCFPAKGITEFVSKFKNLEADKRDTVDMLFAAKFKVNDDGALPERLFLRDKGAEDNFTLNAQGDVPDFQKIGLASESAELCSEDPSREGTPRGGDELSFSIENNVYFLNNSGYHSLTDIKDGLKDGKTHYKKMVPGAMRMLVPKLKYVMIEYNDENTVPQYSAMTGQTPIEGLEHVTFCNNAMIKLKDLEALGADGFKVMGGAYNLTPVPGPKTLAKFTECEVEKSEDKDK